MKEPSGTTNAAATTPASCACAPCDVPAFCRTSYYTGKLLTARDFSDEQRYHVDKRRLHNMALHGWGSVCGLVVKRHPHCPQLRVIVEAGLAIDNGGHEVRLLKDVEVSLPQSDAAPKPKEPCPPDPATAQESPRADPGDSPDEETAEWGKLWLCLRYCERPEQFSPAPFDECDCTGTPQKPNCVRESYCFEWSRKEPKILEEIEKHKHCSLDNCAELYEGILDECSPAACDCIPLAVIHRYQPGCEVQEEMIDNWTPRPLLPSVQRLDQVVRCILEKLPNRKLTHISDINWTHGSDLRCHEFLERFVGKERGFDIRFDGDVRREGINARTFQAMVVHHAEAHQPQRMEIAPAHVEIISPTHIRLCIADEYARRSLDGHHFDLFITLKCDVLVDQRGIAVDGNLLARLDDDGTTYSVDAPTGDGVPGGLFESWVRVHHGERRPEKY